MKKPIAGTGTSRYFYLLEASFFTTMFMVDSLFTQILSSFGYGDGFIGIVCMVMGISCVILQPLFGYFCDKTRNFRALFFAVFALVCAGYPFLFLFSGSRAVVTVFGGLAVASTVPMYTVLDSWISKLQKEIPLNYGRLRACGSISFAVASAVIAPVLEHFGYNAVVPLTWAMFAAMTAAVLSLPNPSRMEDERSISVKEAARVLFGKRDYRILLLCGFLTSTPYNAIQLFSARYISSIGGGVTEIGLASFVRAGAEFVVIMNYDKIAARFGSARTFGFGMACSALRMILFSLAPNATVGILLFLTQAVSLAITIPGVVHYLNRLVPRKYIATAMLLYYTLGQGLAQIIGSPALGALAERYSVKTMFALSSIPGIIGAVIFLAACGRRDPVQADA